MVHVLWHSDKQVRTKLFHLVKTSERPLLIVGARHERSMRPPDQREPFASLARAFGHLLDLVIVADEGTPEGMWRDPLGDLAEVLFPNDKAKAYRAVTSYLVVHRGAARALVKKTGSSELDVTAIRAALHRAKLLATPPSTAARKPHTSKKEPPSSHARRSQKKEETPNPSAPDPYELLGLSRDITLAAARKAYRLLIAQYHPDKVAHLAPEFKELAERRTRELNAAWEALEKGLSLPPERR